MKNCSKIVSRGLKIDLHIHSIYSATKDGKDKVKNGTKDNLPILIQKLNEQGVEMCAITDHDYFNYDLYIELKKEENEGGSIKKVLPGVEFSVDHGAGKVIHIVTIFNDNDDDKIKEIQEIFDTGIGKKLYKNKSYSREAYYEVLKEIDCDFVMIAHQKKSPTSTQRPKNADVMSLGQAEFDKLLFMEYFDAYEFHDKANEIHNKLYGIAKGAEEKMRFITGTDCHDWMSYPYYGQGKTGEVLFTYLKTLPTFKGLAMAITDRHRINLTDSFFGQGKYIDSILFEIEGQDVSVPLSKGINVIIGDNSVGKSLVLHALTENRYISKERNNRLKRGYEKYLHKYNFTVNTHISENDIFKFNYQGQIRGIFDDPNMKADTYLSQYFPEPIDAVRYRKPVERELERLYGCIERKFKYDDRVNNLNSFTLITDEPVDKELIISGKMDSCQISDIQRLLSDLNEIIQKLRNDIMRNVELNSKDRKHLEKEAEFLDTLYIKYQNVRDDKQRENKKVNIYNTCIRKYKEDYRIRQTDESNQYQAFVETKKSIIEDIVSLISQQQEIKPFQFQLTPITVEPEQNPIDTYIFVSKIGIEQVDENYLEELLKSVLKQGEKLNDISQINREKLRHMISRFPNDEDDTLEGLKIKINAKLDKDFEVVKSIIEDQKDVFEELSDGFNSQTYFRLLTGEEKNKGIYIIDQPEDHISPKAIKEHVLEQFRRMSRKRQIIMVTHNPQFIVNLDVDNVIFLSKQSGKFEIKSGALEYEDKDYSILKIVAENIDGGLDTIKRRMKRYDKDI